MDPIPGGETNHTEEFDKRGSVPSLLSISTTNLLSPQPLLASRRRVSISSTIAAPTPPLTPTTPLPETPVTLLPRFEQTFAHNPSATPPPFSNMHPTDTQKTAVTPGASKSAVRAGATGKRKEREFRQRRTRAAKLSKFFGVGYQELEPHLATEKSRTDVQKVEVAIVDGCGMPWDPQELRSLEMEDVIVRLRHLRSS